MGRPAADSDDHIRLNHWMPPGFALAGTRLTLWGIPEQPRKAVGRLFQLNLGLN